MANHLYVFGAAEPTSGGSPGSDYALLYHSEDLGSPDRVEELAKKERAAGLEAFVHFGEAAGRDRYPANPSADLAAAIARAGWVRCWAPTQSELEEAVRMGVPV